MTLLTVPGGSPSDGPKTLKASAYAEIQRLLLTGKLAPGLPITVRALAETLGAGAMPVREAVQQLSAEGALRELPNRSVKVPELTMREFDEIQEARQLLEGRAAARAAVHMTSGEARALEQLLDKVETSLRENSASESLEANLNFHFSVYAGAQSETLLRLINTLWLRVGPLLIFPYEAAAAEQKEFFKSWEIHKDLIEALHNKDSDASQEAMTQIIASSAQWYSRFYRGWA